MIIEITREFELEKLIWRFYFSTRITTGAKPKLRLDKYLLQKRETKRHKFRSVDVYDTHFKRDSTISLKTVMDGSFWYEVVQQVKANLTKEIWGLEVETD